MLDEPSEPNIVENDPPAIDTLGTKNKNKAVIKLFIKYQLLKRLKMLEFRVYLIIIRI